MRVAWIVWLGLIPEIWGCGPVQNTYYSQVNPKTEVSVNQPPPGITVDRFTYRQPFGNIDILFVVDNTESLQTSMARFEKAYRKLLTLWDGPDTRNLSYVLQVATTPDANTASNFGSRERDIQLNLTELFGCATAKCLLGSSERRYMDPVFSTGIGLASNAFSGRSHSPLFVVYLLGADVDPATQSAAIPGLQGKLQTDRGFYQMGAIWVTSSRVGCVFSTNPATHALELIGRHALEKNRSVRPVRFNLG